MKYMLLIFLSVLLAGVGSQAQTANAVLDIQLNKNILQPGDSLLVTVHYKAGEKPRGKQALATVELIIENEQGLQTRLRWPMINGEASGELYLPDSLPQGKYQLMAGLQQRFFEVTGQVQNAKDNDNILAMLLTKKGNWDEQQVPVAADGTFSIRNWLFEDNALLAFSATNNRPPLDIRISTRLDSGNAPLAVAGRTFYVGDPSPAMQQTLDGRVEIPDAAFADQATLLPAVLVRTTTKTRAEQFNEAYVSALFKSGNERVLSVMDDPAAIAYPNILNYLQGRVAGLLISPAGLDGAAATWRGGPVQFFVDEMRVSAQVAINVPMTDVALIKAYPAPFFGSFGGGAGIAVYTRRGGESRYLPANRQVFRIRGYTAGGVVLDMDKLVL